MKRILVPTDFSQTASEALKFAVEIAKANKGQIFVYHVIELPTSIYYNYPFQKEVIEEMTKKANLQYNIWIDKLAHTSVPITFKTKQSVVVSSIEEFVKKNKIDLIVMGTQGASGIKEYIIGSNTEKVVRFSKVPVFAIKKSVKLSSIKHIVFPTLLELNETSVVKRVKELQTFFKARLHVLFVNTPVMFLKGDEIEANFDEYIKHYHLENYKVHIANDMYEQAGITAYVKAHKGSMIAMSTNSRRGLAHFFVGSIAEDIVNHVDCPIWTFSKKK